jgi:hypothetical protein
MTEPTPFGSRPAAEQPIAPASMREILHSASERAVGSDLDRYREKGTALLKVARERLLAAEHAAAIERARLFADMQRKLDAMRQDFREQARRFDADRDRVRRSLLDEIDQLEQMQEVGP